MHSSVAWQLAATTLTVLGLMSIVTPAGAAPVLIHQYKLNDSYADALLGPSLAPNGGTLGPTGYTFEETQGLTLSNGIGTDPGDYSIVIDFSFQNTTSWRKIIDFRSLVSDSGLYSLDGTPDEPLRPALDFYFEATMTSETGTAGTIVANTQAEVVLTRDADSQSVSGYVDGVLQFSFADASGDAVFSGTDNIIYFFMDDETTGFGEASGGFADEIRIYSGALTGEQVALLSPPDNSIPDPQPVPEPASLFLLGGGLLAAAHLRRKLG